MKHYFISHYKNLKYTKDCKKHRGLRNAQIGAIHAISSFFTLNKSKTAVVVMPTGSGKTAVLMMTPYVLLKKKVLVVTPSKMVRGQISEDFSLLNTLCKANVFQKTMARPKVYEMEHKYTEEKFEKIMAADVIIATPTCALSDKINKEYILYIVHYQKDTGLLFIYSQCKSEVQYELIAKSFSESCDKIPKYKMNRVLGRLKDFEIFNSGMLNRYSESGELYRISAGSDVSNAIDPGTGKLYSPGHVFCKANAEDKSITIGYSSGSKMWSSAYLTMPEELRDYPDKIFFVDYNPDTYVLPPALMINGKKELYNTLIDYKLKIIKIKSDKIRISVETEDSEEIIDCDVQGRYKSLTNKITIKRVRTVCV